MPDFLDTMLMVGMVLNLFVLGTSSILSSIGIVAAQGAILALLPLLLHETLSLPLVLSALAAAALKGVAIPTVMRSSLRAAKIKREVEPLIGIMPSVLIGAAATALALLVSRRMDIAPQPSADLIVATAFSTVLVGFVVLTTRFKAITQVIGYLVLENGIYIFGLLLVEDMPLVVEMGVLLDLFVGIFVISIITNHINEAFSSMDTRELSSLKE